MDTNEKPTAKIHHEAVNNAAFDLLGYIRNKLANRAFTE